MFATTSDKLTIIGNNQIGDEGACAIAEAIKSNKTLKELYLRN